ncbi:glycerate kinase [Vallitaleaceae bacterium 9-2]
MKILIASDSFKGSLSSKDICDIATDALTSVLPQAKIHAIALADGGEGTVEALVESTNGVYRNLNVIGPLGEKVSATYGILGDGQTAVIEMSSASGIMLVPQEKLNPLLTTSFGTGELILDAIGQGCTKIIMGIGGSATNDGGVGMLQALGYHFLDHQGKEIEYGGQSLHQIASITFEDVCTDLKDIEFVVACDVDNPLTGPTGATYVYGPQKGGTPDKLKRLEEGMLIYRQRMIDFLGKDVNDLPGSGAAGGMGAGLMAFLDATTGSGFQIISETIALENIIKQEAFDYIFTGEGQLNYQTLHGKLPHGIARLGKKYGVPVIAVVGSLNSGYEQMYDEGLTAAFSIISYPMSLDEAIINARELAYQTYQNIAKLL